MKEYVLVDYRIAEEELHSFKKLGIAVLKCPPCNNLYSAVCGHPDMLLNILNENTILVHKDMCLDFKKKLLSLNLNILNSNESLKETYPYDVILNSLNLNNFFVHYLKYTDKTLLSYVKNKKLINVKQGYTKCSTAIINERAIITSDTGIASSLEHENFDVLLLPPKDIFLPGLDYGFIGGTCGIIRNNYLAFYGDLNYYKYGNLVLDFLNKHKMKPIFLRKGPLIDRGSIFYLKID